MPDVWKLVEPLEVEHRYPICQNSDQNNSGRKEIEKRPCGGDKRPKVKVKEGSPIKWIAFNSTLSRGEVEGKVIHT